MTTEYDKAEEENLFFSTMLKIDQECFFALKDRIDDLEAGKLTGAKLLAFVENHGAVRHNLHSNNNDPAEIIVYEHNGKKFVRRTFFEDGLKTDDYCFSKSTPAVQILEKQGDREIVIAAQHFNKGVAGHVLSKEELLEANDGILKNGLVGTTIISYSHPVFAPEELGYEPH